MKQARRSASFNATPHPSSPWITWIRQMATRVEIRIHLTFLFLYEPSIVWKICLQPRLANTNT
eukprot:989625-Pyramimonas_sp.AAC.1